MYVIIDNGPNPIKYTTENIELLPDGVKIDGDIYPCTIVQTTDNKDDGFAEIHISAETYIKILKNKNGVMTSVKDEDVKKTGTLKSNNGLFEEYFTARTDKFIKKKDNESSTICYYFENGKLMLCHTRSMIDILVISPKLYDDLVKYSFDDYFFRYLMGKFLTKNGHNRQFHFHKMTSDSDEFIQKIEKSYGNNENPNYNQIIMPTTKDYLDFFEESTKSIIKRKDHSVYPNTEFWFIDDELILENHSMYNIFWFNTTFFEPLFELKYQLGTEQIKEIFDNIIPIYFGIESKKISDVTIFSKEEVTEYFSNDTKEPEKFIKIFRDIQSIEKKDDCSISDAFCKLSEEFGELAQGICKSIGRKNHQESNAEILDNVKEEIADLIQNCMFIAIKFGIDPYDLLETIEKKNIKWRKLPYLNKKDGDSIVKTELLTHPKKRTHYRASMSSYVHIYKKR